MQFTITSFLIALTAGAALAQARIADPSASQATAASTKAANEKAHAAAIANCEAMWEQATHMTRKDWARACRRVQARLQQLELK
jgi:hypothetical protein